MAVLPTASAAGHVKVAVAEGGAGRAETDARAWRAWAALGAAALAAWAVLSAWTPPGEEAWSVCLFRRLTHVPCATCGMTRAFSALAHGDLRGSLALHPLAAPLAAEAAALWLLAPLALRTGWRPGPTLGRGWLVAHLTLLLAAWVARLSA